MSVTLTKEMIHLEGCNRDVASYTLGVTNLKFILYPEYNYAGVSGSYPIQFQKDITKITQQVFADYPNLEEIRCQAINERELLSFLDAGFKSRDILDVPEERPVTLQRFEKSGTVCLYKKQFIESL